MDVIFTTSCLEIALIYLSFRVVFLKSISKACWTSPAHNAKFLFGRCHAQGKEVQVILLNILTTLALYSLLERPHLLKDAVEKLKEPAVQTDLSTSLALFYVIK